MSFILKGAQDGVNRMLFGKDAKTSKTAFYELVDRLLMAKPEAATTPMSTYQGDVVMVVNIHDEYAQRGLKILAFPCNQFGGQEPGTPQEILDFVKKFDEKMSEKLVFFEKGDVNGANTREVFSFLKEKLPDEDGSQAIRWNF
ncbi:MAG: hypothetical protein SGARI_008188, partial [Bacillariaceae sp.]